MATASISASNYTCPAFTQLDSSGEECLCKEGYYGSGGSCAACGLGSYKEDVGNALGCSDCPAGGVTVSTGSTSPSNCTCPPGSELDAFGTACLCSAGYFGSDGACQACPKGAYKAEVRNTVGCNQCPNGSTTGGTGSMSGDSCEAPLHSTLDPISGSFVCLAGYFGSAASGCERCPAGTYKDVNGSAPCSLCSHGNYWTLSGGISESTCSECPSYTYSPVGSSMLTNCTCNKGYTGPDGIQCAACIAGTYKDVNGSAPCSPCSEGKYSTETGEMLESTCSKGSLYSMFQSVGPMRPNLDSGTYSAQARKVGCGPGQTHEKNWIAFTQDDVIRYNCI